MTDYYRSEASQPLVGYAEKKFLPTLGDDEDDETIYDQAGVNPSQEVDSNFFSPA